MVRRRCFSDPQAMGFVNVWQGNSSRCSLSETALRPVGRIRRTLSLLVPRLGTHRAMTTAWRDAGGRAGGLSRGEVLMGWCVGRGRGRIVPRWTKSRRLPILTLSVGRISSRVRG